MSLQPRPSRLTRRFRQASRRATACVLENLESRQMLTRVFAGQSFEFQQVTGNEGTSGQIVRVTVTGNAGAFVDLSGATMVGTTPTLNDVPGEYDDGTPEVLGGVGGRHGVLPISVITGGDSFIDLLPAGGPPPIQQHFSTGVNFEGLASNKAGATWGVNFRAFQGQTSGNLVEISQFAYQSTSDATVRANVAGGIVALTGADDTNSIQSISGADFLPSDDNLLFFVATVSVSRSVALNPGSQNADADIPFLFSFNTSNNNLQLVGEFESDAGQGGAGDVAPDVLGFSFINGTDQIVAFENARELRNNAGAGSVINTQAGLVVLTLGDLTLPNGLLDVQPINLGDTELDDVHALEVVDDEHVYAITGNGASSELIRIRTADGLTEDFGPLPNDNFTNDPGGTPGENISDLTWNPTLRNPYLQTDSNPNNDNKKGVLLGVDLDTDQLVVVDTRSHFPFTSLYSITLGGGDASASVSIAVVDNIDVTGPRPMQPFQGSVQLNTVNAQNGNRQLSTTAAGSGEVLIGLKTLDTIDGTADEEEIAIRRIKSKSSTGKVRYVYAGIFSNGDWGNVLVGGLVTGRVALNGSMQMLYAGALWTGDPQGRAQGADFSDVAGNFYVNGDLRNLVTLTSLGTDTGSSGAISGDIPDDNTDKVTYANGFDMQVLGHLGQVKTLDSFTGRATVANSLQTTYVANQHEVEFRAAPVPTTSSNTYFQGFGSFAQSLGDRNPNANFFNDTSGTAQYLGTMNAPSLGGQGILVDGELNGASNVNDNVDYYGVALLAGQTVSVRLTTLNPIGLLQVGVYDTDVFSTNTTNSGRGRLIATDYSRLDGAVTGDRINAGQVFQFTAKQPGTYRFAVAFKGDSNFNGALDAGESQSRSNSKYTLQINGVNDIALGAVVAGQSIFTQDLNTFGFEVDRGDLGALHADVRLFSHSLPYFVPAGNLRSIDSDSIGFVRAGAALSGPDLLVSGGSVGLVRATGSEPTNTGGSLFGDCLNLNDGLTVSFIDPTSLDPDPSVAVGMDYQLIDAQNTLLTANLSANRSIGMIRARSVISSDSADGIAGQGNVAVTNRAPVWIANADHLGDDGRIDLVDVLGDLGGLGNGGPSIYTGPSGNVRYVRVGGLLYSSTKFGGSLRQHTPLQPGQQFVFTDDSGTRGIITPGTNVLNPNPTDLIGGTDRFLGPGVLTVRTLATDDNTKGGVILVDVNVDDPLNSTGFAGNHGVDIKADGVGSNGSIEVGTLRFFDLGARTALHPDTGESLIAPFDIPDPITGAFRGIVFPADRQNEGNIVADLQSPINATFHGSERVDVFSIVGQTAGGVATHINDVTNETDGEIVNVDAASVRNITANFLGMGRRNTSAEVQGANIQPLSGPFVRQRNAIFIHGNTQFTTSYLGNANAREAVGNIQVDGIIGTVRANSDGTNVKGVFEGIAGPIYAGVGPGNTITDARIDRVIIGDGIAFGGTGEVPLAGVWAGDTITTVQNRGLGSDIRGPVVSAFAPQPTLPNPVDGWSIGALRLESGAIIDAPIMITQRPTDWTVFSKFVVMNETPDTLTNPRFDIREINVSGPGGIMGAFIQAPDVGPIKINGGFGFLNSLISVTGDGVIDGIETSGLGIRDSIIRGGATVTRLVANGTGRILDTNAFTPTARVSNGKTSIDPFTGLQANRHTDLYRYLGTSPEKPKKSATTTDGVIENVVASGSRELTGLHSNTIRRRGSGEMRLSFGNQVKGVLVDSTIDGLQLDTGGLKSFVTGGDMTRASLNVSGTITSVSIGGNLKGTSIVRASGPEGRILSLATKRALFGTVFGQVAVGTISVGTDLGSSNVRSQSGLDKLSVGGSILTDAFVKASGKLTKLIVGGDIQDGAIVQAGAIGSQNIGGDLLGDVVIT